MWVTRFAPELFIASGGKQPPSQSNGHDTLTYVGNLKARLKGRAALWLRFCASQRVPQTWQSQPLRTTDVGRYVIIVKQSLFHIGWLQELLTLRHFTFIIVPQPPVGR